MILSRGMNPMARESFDALRLSPSTKYSSCGIVMALGSGLQRPSPVQQLAVSTQGSCV